MTTTVATEETDDNDHDDESSGDCGALDDVRGGGGKGPGPAVPPRPLTAQPPTEEGTSSSENTRSAAPGARLVEPAVDASSLLEAPPPGLWRQPLVLKVLPPPARGLPPPPGEPREEEAEDAEEEEDEEEDSEEEEEEGAATRQGRGEMREQQRWRETARDQESDPRPTLGDAGDAASGDAASGAASESAEAEVDVTRTRLSSQRQVDQLAEATRAKLRMRHRTFASERHIVDRAGSWQQNCRARSCPQLEVAASRGRIRRLVSD